MKTAHQILEEGRNLIAKPENWTQEDFAKAADGSGVYSHSDEAVCWCSLGALNKVSLPDANRQANKQAKILLRNAMGTSIAAFNDTHTHEEVLAAWDKAIELAKEEQNESA